MENKKQIGIVISIIILVVLMSPSVFAQNGEKNEESLVNSSYVGSEQCGECHGEVYESYMENSKKSHSFSVVKRMSASVPAEDMKACPQCHATGYQQGGFISYEQTPEFADVGCEACHGPGSAHAESAAIEDIGLPTLETCATCHTESVKANNYMPLLFSAAH